MLFLITFLFSQKTTDARMVGLNSAYTNLADGFQCVGINPANLSVYKKKALNVFNLSFGISTNSLSITNYNVLTGANFEDDTATNYYSKDDFLKFFNNEGLRVLYSLNVPIPLNISYNNYAFTSSFVTNMDIGIPFGFIDFLLFGNPFNKKISTEMRQSISISQQMGISYANTFKNFSAGITIKYILGLMYMGMEPINNPSISTSINGFSGQSQYIIKQAIGGSGLGLDFGIITEESPEGYRYGISIINLLGKIKWTQDHFMRSQIDDQLKSSLGDFYLRPNEMIYMNMVMDSVTAISFTNTSGDPLVYYEKYKVIPIDNIDNINMTSIDSSLLITLTNGTYLFPSGGEYVQSVIMPSNDSTLVLSDNYDSLITGNNNQFVTRQPMYFRFGISKKWEKDIILLADLVTGFSDQFNSSSNWKLSIGSEITRFKNNFIRFGYSFGGVAKRSASIGYGRKFGALYLDFGVAFNGGLNLETAKGFDYAFGIKLQI